MPTPSGMHAPWLAVPQLSKACPDSSTAEVASRVAGACSSGGCVLSHLQPAFEATVLDNFGGIRCLDGSGLAHREACLLSCRQYMEENHIEEHLRRLLPREEGRPVEKPAEAALRKRM